MAIRKWYKKIIAPGTKIKKGKFVQFVNKRLHHFSAFHSRKMNVSSHPGRAPRAFAAFRLATIYLPFFLLLKWVVVKYSGGPFPVAGGMKDALGKWEGTNNNISITYQ